MYMWLLLALAARAPQTWNEDREADHRALARMARGDHDALAELYDRHSRPIYSLALRILQDRSDAEDVVQEVFVQAWSQASRYDASRGAASAWLLNMTRSRAIDRLRSKRSRPDLGRTDRSGALNVADAAEGQDLQLLSREQLTKLRTALDALPFVQRTALELAYYEGLSHTEIAERLEQPLGTVKTRIRQAILKLRSAMA
jgi:RNA polymerase sigma-70 factor, ECF subfamily